MFVDEAVTTLAMEPVPLAEIGYANSGALHLLGRPLVASLSLAMPIFLVPRGRDARVALSASSTVFVRDRWQVVAGMGAFLGLAADSLGSSRAIGFSVGVAPRYVGTRWFAGTRVHVRSTALLHITNSAFAETPYGDRYTNGSNNSADPSEPRVEGPRDGWYAWTAFRAFAGVEGGRRFGDRLVVSMGAGTWWTPQAQGLFFAIETGQIPVYVHVDAHAAF